MFFLLLFSQSYFKNRPNEAVTKKYKYFIEPYGNIGNCFLPISK